MTDLQAMLRYFEGDRLDLYWDTAEPPQATIGIGHNLSANGISPVVRDMMFSEDTVNAIDAARSVCSIYEQLTRPRQLVLLSMAFQMGQTRLSKWVHFLNALHQEDWEEAAGQILASKAAKDPKLMTRFNILANMMRTNVSQWI